MAEITDDLVETHIIARNAEIMKHHSEGARWPQDYSPTEIEEVRMVARAGLSAVAPLIRAAAFREAAAVAFSLVEKSSYAAEHADDQWQDGWIVGASDQAEGTRDAIIALAEKETK